MLILIWLSSFWEVLLGCVCISTEDTTCSLFVPCSCHFVTILAFVRILLEASCSLLKSALILTFFALLKHVCRLSGVKCTSSLFVTTSVLVTFRFMSGHFLGSIGSTCCKQCPGSSTFGIDVKLCQWYLGFQTDLVVFPRLLPISQDSSPGKSRPTATLHYKLHCCFFSILVFT